MNLKECMKYIERKIIMNNKDTMKQLDILESRLKEYYNILYPHYLIHKAVDIIKKELKNIYESKRK